MTDFEKLCPLGTNVRIIAPNNSEHEGWFIMPVVRDRSEMFIPPGYELIEGVGRVTSYEETDNTTPVRVENFIKCQFNEDWWLKEMSEE